ILKAKMAETGAVFGGEHTPHYYFSDFFNADSGMLAALNVLATLVAQEKPLSELKGKYERYIACGGNNCEVADQTASTKAVVDAVADRTVSSDDMDGVTVELTGGAWFNVRASNTEPLLRLNAEAATQEEVDAIVEEALRLIRG